MQLGHPIGMALVVVQLHYGLGRPAYYLTPHQFQEFSKYAYGEWLQVIEVQDKRKLLMLTSEFADIRHPYVHQSLHLPFPSTHYDHQSIHSTPASCGYHLGCEQRHLESPVDSAMHTTSR